MILGNSHGEGGLLKRGLEVVKGGLSGLKKGAERAEDEVGDFVEGAGDVALGFVDSAKETLPKALDAGVKELGREGGSSFSGTREPHVTIKKIDGKLVEVTGGDLLFYAKLLGDKKGESLKFVYARVSDSVTGDNGEMTAVVDNRNSEQIDLDMGVIETGHSGDLLIDLKNLANRIATNLGRPVEIVDSSGLILFSVDTSKEVGDWKYDFDKERKKPGFDYNNAPRAEGWDRVKARQTIESQLDFRESKMYFARQAAEAFDAWLKDKGVDIGKEEEVFARFFEQNSYYASVPMAEFKKHIKIGFGAEHYTYNISVISKERFIQEEIDRQTDRKE